MGTFDVRGVLKHYKEIASEEVARKQRDFAIFATLELDEFRQAIINLAELEQARLGRKVGYNITKVNEPIIKRLYEYLHSDEGRIRNLLICGGYGSGKTLLLTAFFRFVSFYCKAPSTRWDFFKSNVTNLAEKENRYCIIDEMGREELAVKQYGNETTPFISFLIKRYDNGTPTIAISNFKLTDLADNYGVYIADRLGEMFEVLEMVGENYRKQ